MFPPNVSEISTTILRKLPPSVIYDVIVYVFGKTAALICFLVF